MLLSDRMLAVAGLVEPCAVMADIGCDHGYVAMELIRRHTCEKVIAMDINRGPLEQARGNISGCGMQERIETRLSDGVAALRRGEADGIICAGMGGRLIIRILTEGRELIGGMKQLVLQPQSEIGEVRQFLWSSGFYIECEDMVYEDGKYYPMLRASADGAHRQERIAANTSDAILRRVQAKYGPCLLQTGHPVLQRYLLWRKDKLENIRSGLIGQCQPGDRGRTRAAQLESELADIDFCLGQYFR